MVSLTLKVILHVAENDSKYRDVAPLKKHKHFNTSPKSVPSFNLFLKRGRPAALNGIPSGVLFKNIF